MSAGSNDTGTPVVSVCITTYQHVGYIGQCLDSVIAQVTSFPVEIIIGEDGSTDGTREICQQYADRYPGIIRLLLHDRKDVHYVNGKPTGRKNFTRTVMAAKGKYIALCEGDDYWCDQSKLEQQVAMLADSTLVACHHWQRVAKRNSEGIFAEESAPKEGHGYHPAATASVREIFQNELRVKSRTIMFRNILKQGVEFPDWFYRVRFGDVPLTMILGMHGNFGFIDKEMAVYRMTGAGVSKWGKEDTFYFLNHQLEWVAVWEEGNRFYKGEYQAESFVTILYFYERALEKYSFAGKVFMKCVRYVAFRSSDTFGRRVRVFLRLAEGFFKKRLN